MFTTNYSDFKVYSIRMPQLSTLEQVGNLKKRIELSKVVSEDYNEEIQTANEELHELKTENVLNSNIDLIEKIITKQNQLSLLLQKKDSSKVEPLELAPIESAIARLKQDSITEALGYAETYYSELKDKHRAIIDKHLINMIAVNDSAKELAELEATIEVSTRGLYYGQGGSHYAPTNWLSPLDVFEGETRKGRDDDFEKVSSRFQLWESLEKLITNIKESPKFSVTIRESGYFFLPIRDMFTGE